MTDDVDSATGPSAHEALQAVREALSGAAPGPWSFQPWGSHPSPSGDYAESILFDRDGEELVRGLSNEDGALAANAPGLLSGLCDLVDVLQSSLLSMQSSLADAEALLDGLEAREERLRQELRLAGEVRDILLDAPDPRCMKYDNEDGSENSSAVVKCGWRRTVELARNGIDEWDAVKQLPG